MIISTRYIRGMTQNHLIRIRTLIERLAKITTAVDWQDGLNPAQYNALSYLALANRYSRSPSHVADYLCTTRGTASQTLKSLEQKGFIHSVASATDKRSTTYQMTRLYFRPLLKQWHPSDAPRARVPPLHVPTRQNRQSSWR